VFYLRVLEPVNYFSVLLSSFYYKWVEVNMRAAYILPISCSKCAMLASCC